jgi:tetratricopeptide (TPR) repeat protein
MIRTMTEPRAPIHRPARRAVALAALFTAWGAPAVAQMTDAQQYRSCLLRIRDDPALAIKLAEDWRAQGGGAPAQHCVALALLAAGNHQGAAVRLEALADVLTEDRSDLRPDVLAQAAQAWVFARQPERAIKALDAAIALKPKDTDLVVDRAVMHAGAGRLVEAERDLDRALSMEAERDDALALRATVRRKAGRMDDARKDADRAVQLNPKNADAWLERGVIRHAKGDKAGAEADWRQATEAAPDSPAAKAAAANLNQGGPKP